MIKAVFLDLYGTLAQFHPSREDVQAQACQSLGIQATHEGLSRGYTLADEYMEQENAGRVPLACRSGGERQDFFARYEQLLLKGAGVEMDLETAGRVWEQVQHIPYGMALFHDVLPALDMLKLQGLTLGAVK